MFKYRAISFPILIALLAVMILWPSWGMYLFAVVAGVAGGLMIYEAGKMAERIGIRSYVSGAAVAGGAGLGFLLLSYSFRFGRMGRCAILSGVVFLVCFVLMVFGGWLLLLFRRDKKAAVTEAFGSAGILLLCEIPLIALAMVYFTPGLGPIGLFFVMMVTKAMDTGGYLCGMASAKLLPGGNHKIVPSISPKKSWEGTVGGVLFSVGVGMLFYWLFRAKGIGIFASSSWYIVTGIVLAVGSFAGDLTESALKRACEVKDSGHWIPGMGGAFDVLDSFLYNGALFWFLVFFIW